MTPQEIAIWLRERGLTRAEIRSFVAESRDQTIISENDLMMAFDVWQAKSQTGNQYQDRIREEVRQREEAARQAEQGDDRTTGEIIADLEAGQVADQQAEPQTRVLPSVTSLQQLFNTGQFAGFDPTSPQNQLVIESIAAQLLATGAATTQEEATSMAMDQAMQNSAVVYTSLEDRQEFSRQAVPTQEDLDWERENNPERYMQLAQDAMALGYADQRRTDQIEQLYMKTGRLPLRSTNNIIRKTIMAANEQRGQSRDEREQMLRQAVGMIGSGLSDMSEVMAHFDIGTDQADEFMRDFLGYQAKEWTIDFGPAPGRQRPDRAWRQADSRVPFDGMTITEAQAAFSNFSEEERIQIQSLMMEMGLYEGEAPPALGFLQEQDRAAYARFMSMIQVNHTSTPTQIVRQAIRNNRDQILRDARFGYEDGDLDGDGIPDQIYTLTSKETLGATIDDAVSRLTGRKMATDNAMKNDLIAQAQRREMDYLRALNGAFIRNRLETGEGLGRVDDVDLFLAAVGGQESGGNYSAYNTDSGASGKYQFMPGTWREWARNSGLGANAQQTPENQEHVARSMASYYFNQWGNWYDAAIAWYMGPGRVGDVTAQTRSQGRYPSGRTYAQEVLARMRNIQTDDINALTSQHGFGVQVTEDGMTFVEDFDRESYLDNLVRSQDRAGVQSWDYHSNARAFIGMLGSTV